MIRYSKDSDAFDIGKIFCLTWKEAYKNIIPNDYLDTLTIEQSIPKKINHLNNLVIEINDEVVGIVNFGNARDTDLINLGEIRAIYILPLYWDKGFGKKLFTNAMIELNKLGYQGFYLWVLKDNYRACHFYENMGMKCTNDIKTINIGGKDLLEVRYEYSNFTL